MKKIFLALAVLLLGAVPVHAAVFPMAEADYLKEQDEHFALADLNKNGQIDREEASTAFADAALLPNAAARQACAKAGYDLSSRYTPSTQDPAFQPMRKEQFMASRKAMFDAIDANHDHSITQAEMDGFSARMVQLCGMAPELMRNLKNTPPGGVADPALMEKFKALAPARAGQGQ